MIREIIPLPEVLEGQEVVLVSIKGGLGLKRRLRDMGVQEGGRIKVLHSHRPGPCIIQTGNTRLVLGYGMAHQVFVRKVRDGQ